MVMANLTGTVLQGYDYGRGIALQEEDRETRKAQEKREGSRKARLSGLLGSYARGNKAALGGIAEMGPEGINAAATLGKLDMARVEQSKAKMKDSWRLMRNLPQEQQQQASQAMIAHAVQSGILTKEQANPISYMAQDDNENFVKQMDGWFGIEAPKRSPVGGLKTLVMPDGTQEAFDVTNPEQRQGFMDAVSAGGKPAPSQQEVGKPGDFNLTKKQKGELLEAEIGTRQAIASANDILAKMDENPDAFQQVGSMASFVSGMSAEAVGIARAAGVDIPDTIYDLEQYEDSFTKLGVESDVAKGAIFDLALSYAAASGLGTGKALSDKDVKNAMRRVGAGGVSTPAGRRAMVEDVSRALARKFKIRYKVMSKGREFEGDLGAAEAVEAAAADVPPNGSRSTTADGTAIIVVNGEWTLDQGTNQ
jgi:hypothetical protein